MKLRAKTALIAGVSRLEPPRNRTTTTRGSINGTESLVRTLVASWIDTCFANSGTSEMHFVAALDRVPGIRCVLAPFQGVATGAADGYARLVGRPAVTLRLMCVNKKMSVCSYRQDLAMKVQWALSRRGYCDGPIDGVLGPDGTRAIRAFQEAQRDDAAERRIPKRLPSCWRRGE
jgi:hypothetical protein